VLSYLSKPQRNAVRQDLERAWRSRCAIMVGLAETFRENQSSPKNSRTRRNIIGSLTRNWTALTLLSRIMIGRQSCLLTRPPQSSIGGRISEKRGDLEAAATDYDRVIRLSPDWSSPYFSRAVLFERDNQLSEAQVYCDKASKLSPEWTEACASRARFSKAKEATSDGNLPIPSGSGIPYSSGNVFSLYGQAAVKPLDFKTFQSLTELSQLGSPDPVKCFEISRGY
jgi:tetratricopeptide (TPR) repeat protein